MFIFIAFYIILKHSLNQTCLISKKSWNSMKDWMTPLLTGEFKNASVALISEAFPVISSLQLFSVYYGTTVLQMQTLFWDHKENNLAEQKGHIH